jgi:hypothetical protein
LFCVLLFNGGMMTNDEIRRENLAALIEKYGTSSALSKETGISENQISQWKNASKDSRTRKPRGMSDEACRQIEETCSLERGWMDNPHGNEAAPNPKQVSTDEIAELISLFGECDRLRKNVVLAAARGAAAQARLSSAAND